MWKASYHLKLKCYRLLFWDIWLEKLCQTARAVPKYNTKSTIFQMHLLLVVHKSTECRLWNLKSPILEGRECTTRKHSISFGAITVRLSYSFVWKHTIGQTRNTNDLSVLPLYESPKEYRCFHDQWSRTVKPCQKPFLHLKVVFKSVALKLTDLSWFEIPPVSHKFSFDELHCSVDAYANFQMK